MKRLAPIAPPPAESPLVDRHLRVGWRALLVFATLGLGLETLHGFKARWYVDPSSETRRLMWTLAHAHGTLLALVNIAFAASLRLRPARDARRVGLASSCLLAATAALPLGFFLGGLIVHAGDPGLGIVLVPIGGLLLLGAIGLIAF